MTAFLDQTILNTTRLTRADLAQIIYPSSDGEPLAESYLHLYAIIVTLTVLQQYLQGQQAMVLADQFLYYAEGFPRLRVAPDVMVILGVEPGPRDNYKIWQERQVPAVIFEMTSPKTRNEDTGTQKSLYENLGVQEYWLFDPKGEWLEPRLKGYTLVEEVYQPITDGVSQVLQLRLETEDSLIRFYRLDNGAALLTPDEIAQTLSQERDARAQELRQKEQAEAELAKLKAQLRELGVEPNL
jgi:Uma2 family endonuclease